MPGHRAKHDTATARLPERGKEVHLLDTLPGRRRGRAMGVNNSICACFQPADEEEMVRRFPLLLEDAAVNGGSIYTEAPKDWE